MRAGRSDGCVCPRACIWRWSAARPRCFPRWFSGSQFGAVPNKMTATVPAGATGSAPCHRLPRLRGDGAVDTRDHRQLVARDSHERRDAVHAAGGTVYPDAASSLAAAAQTIGRSLMLSRCRGSTLPARRRDACRSAARRSMPCEVKADVFRVATAWKRRDHPAGPPRRRPPAVRRKLALNTGRAGVVHPDLRCARDEDVSATSASGRRPGWS
jgi:hypothetical protein